MSTDEEMKILVAVDFGTTFSGIAYVNTLNPSRRTVIQSWGAGNLTGEKAPTVLKYDNHGTTGPFKWGFQVPEDAKRHEWFKLGLCPEFEASQSDLVKKYPSPTALPRVAGDECEKLVVDYLTSLRNHADSYFKSLFDSIISETTPREYIITVPAIWTDRAQYRTRVCAERAGMGDRNELQIISEPEAAGIFALDTMPNIGLNVGETFVVCDAGGGTVDLVSYTIKTLKPSPSVYETAPGSGGLCGSSFLNRIFSKYLEDRMKGHREWNEDYQGDALRFFEKEIKPRFTGNDDEVYYIMVQGLSESPRFRIKNRRLEVSGSDLREKVFEPVMKEIQKLVRNQISATTTDTVKVKAVLLAGGFGRNEYLRRKLQETVGRDVQVRPVENSNTAIVRGALIRGLAEKVTDLRVPNWRVDSRIARKHFGICCYEAFDPSKHELHRREGHPFAGGYRVKVMKWFVEKGATIKEAQAQSFGFYYDQKVSNGRPKSIDIDIFVCEDPEAPPYKTESVKEHVKLQADLSTIPEALLNKETQSGQAFYKIDFDIEMALHSASLTFALVYRGDKYQTVHVEFV